MNLSDIILHSLIKKDNINTEKAVSLIYDLIDHSYNNQLNDIKLIKESELNSIEYKLRLDTKTSYGLEKTISQIKRRLTTSKQLTEVEEAHYIFGVTDKGELGNITLEETEATYNIFKELVESKKLNANICNKFEYLFGNSSIYYVIINKKNNIKFNELKISFVGTSSSGKTTTISNIIHGSISKKKINLLFKHEHEKLSGKTSSIKKEIIGLKSGKIVNYKTIKDSNSTDIAIESDIIINILDYPGTNDNKKIKNIFKGLLGYSSDLIFIVVECFKLDDPPTKEIIDLYYNISKLLNIKSVILANKIDILDNPICLTNYYPDLPIIYISNILENGINNLIEYIENIAISDKNKIITKQTGNLFTVMEIINIPDKGVVFSGNMDIGNYNLGDLIILTNGIECIETKIISIHKKYIDSGTIYEGETGSIQLENVYSIPNYYKRSVITRKPLVTYNNINFVINNITELLNLTIDQEFKLYIGNMRTNAIIKTITKTSDKIILLLKINSIALPKLEMLGQDVGILRDENYNTYYGKVCIISIVN